MLLSLWKVVQRAPYAVLAIVLILAVPLLTPAANPAGEKAADRSPADAVEKANAALKSGDAPAKPDGKAAPPAAQSDDANLIEFYKKGGPLMYPITALSFLSIFFIVERFLALRRSKVVPSTLVRKLGELATSPAGFDPRRAYKLCQQYPSSAANVIRAMLLKVGRPNSEVESTVQATADREASRLYGNIRPIALAATVAPMFGLLGTVLGMIQLFHAASAVGVTMDSALLSSGIYTKLITTFAGLCVAIPSAIFTQVYEGKIISMFHDVGDLAESLVPQVERYEGKLRITSKQLDGAGESFPESNGSSPAHASLPPVLPVKK